MKIEDTKHIKKCSSCRFFVCYANDYRFGWCHRNAPLPHKRSEESADMFYKLLEAPIVRYQFWCGQYEKFTRSKRKS